MAVNDTFTDVNATNVIAHTSDSGHTWSNHPVKTPSSPSFIITPPGRVRPRANVGQWLRSSWAPAAADYDVELDLVLLTSDGSFSGGGVVGRMDSAAATGYVFRFRSDASLYELVRVIAGTETVLQSVASGAFAVETRRIKLEMRGSALKGYVSIGGGAYSEICSQTDANISAAGSAGIEERGPAGSTTLVHWDNFTATDASVDNTPPTLSSPTAAAASNTTGTGSVSTDEANGTLYFVVTTSSTAPTAAQVRAGQDHTGAAAVDFGSQAVSGTGAQSITGGFTGLSAGTTYYAHYHQRDAANNDSTVVSSASFTTESAPVVSITSPTAGVVQVPAGTIVVVTFTATDAEDGDLAASAEVTSSNTDDGTAGALGTGTPLQINTTGWADGARTITVTATDLDTNTGTDSFTLTIGGSDALTAYMTGRAAAAQLGGY